MVHLHVRSHFSFGGGASSSLALARAAVAHGQKALAITDLNTLSGVVRHASACRAAGIKAIFGATVTVDGCPLILLCVDHAGYANLCDIITLAHSHAAESGDRKNPHISLSEVRGHAEGLICLTGDQKGALSEFVIEGKWSQARKLATELHELFTGRLYIELVHHELPDDKARMRGLIQLADELKIPTVATNAVRHATRAEFSVYDALTCVGLKLTVAQGHPDRPQNCSAYLCSGKWALKRGLPAEAIANTHAIAEMCNVDLMPGEVLPPTANVPNGTSAAQYLNELCQEGLAARGLAASEKAKAQLEHEYRIITKLQLEEFFLVVREVTEFARSRAIRCCGRGSAANSLIAYLLYITEVDPIEQGLLFERFLHEGRASMPDIDVDFDSERRPEVIEWMAKRWGEGHTAMTANISTFQLKSALVDMGKVLGYSLLQLRRASKVLPHRSARHARDYRADLAPILGDGPALDVLLGLVAALHDCPRNLSLHSGGMVLSRLPLRHLSPIQTSANGVRQIQVNKDDVELLGLIKFDVLSLRMLAVLSEALTLLRSVGEEAPDLERTSLEDEFTYDLICSGWTLGLFQIESPGQWSLLARTQPRNLSDLILQVAMFRPGPLQGKMVNPLVERRCGRAKVTYPHPSLEPVLRDTYGVLLFQEQVLETVHIFAGMALKDADEFRRLVSKHRDPDQMEAMRAQFVRSAIATHLDTKHPVSLGLANAIFDLVAAFVGYGFCRSHASAFALTVYKSAYLKTHYVTAYMAAVMQHLPGFYPIHSLLEEARHFGVTVLPVCILSSNVKYTVEKLGDELAIRIPLTQVEHVSPEAAAQIVLERSVAPFDSIDELYRRVQLSSEAWDSLARSGALDAFGERKRVLWHLGRLKRQTKSKSKGRQLSLLDQMLPIDLPMESPPLFPLSDVATTQWDFSTLSLTTGPHPMAHRRADIARFGALPIAALSERKLDSTAMVAGAVISRMKPPTAKGFCFIVLEDETGRLPIAINPVVYDRLRTVIREPHLLVEGKLESHREISSQSFYRSLFIERIWSLDSVTGIARAVTVGASGFPGESPRFATRAEATA